MRVRAVWLGRRRYEPIHALQRALVEARSRREVPDTILLVEHDPVITLGRGADRNNVLLGKDQLLAKGVDLVEIGRGGDVTYHGPGQLVGYPLLDLKPDRCDVRKYVRALAEVMILLAREYHVEAGVVDRCIGSWVDAAEPSAWAGEAWAADLRKVGAIGVRISRWITMHGFALNLAVDMNYFQLIVPCGIRDRGVTSIQELVGSAPTVAEAALGSTRALARGLDLAVERVEDFAAVSESDLGKELGL